MSTLIVCFGNPLMGDDGFGPRVLEMLAGQPLPAQTVLKDLQAPGVDVLLHLEGVDRLILIDALASGGQPGTLRTFDRDTLLEIPVDPRSSPHQPSLLETLHMARALKLLPESIHLVAASARRFEFGAGLSAEIEAALPAAVEAVLGLL
jgi:hydrogenase maturation protease